MQVSHSVKAQKDLMEWEQHRLETERRKEVLKVEQMIKKATNCEVRREIWLDKVASSDQFKKHYLEGYNDNESKHQTSLRKRDYYKEIHPGDGIYVRKYENEIDRSLRKEKEYKKSFLEKGVFDERKDLNKQFHKWLRER